MIEGTGELLTWKNRVGCRGDILDFALTKPNIILQHFKVMSIYKENVNRSFSKTKKRVYSNIQYTAR